MAIGQGQSAGVVNATVSKNLGGPPGPATDGEVGGTGSVYSATLVQRENKAATRNVGPSRAGGLIGGATIPTATASSRRVNRIG